MSRAKLAAEGWSTRPRGKYDIESDLG